MSSLKRAKWIEGITQSKRILRDMAEILTTAIRDEESVVPEENWSLVYPRPFSDEKLTRTRMIQDETNKRKYVPVASRTDRGTLVGTTAMKLTEKEPVESSIVVKSEDGSVTYTVTKDYTYNKTEKSIVRTAASTIPDGSKVQVIYDAKLFAILDTVPVVVEKSLKIAEPNRELARSTYNIDYAGKRIMFLGDAPTDAEYFALTFTEVTGTYDRIERELLRLEKDLLDPDGRTFRLPAGYGEIAQTPDTREVAGTISGGALGSNGSGNIQYTLDGKNHTVKFTTGSKTLLDTQTLYINCSEYTDASKSATRKIRVQLAIDTSDNTNKTYKLVGTFNELNDGEAHNVEIVTQTTAPALFKHLSSLHAGYELVASDEIVVDYKGCVITTIPEITDDLVATFTARREDDVKAGLERIKDRVVLKTTTKPEQEYKPVIGDQYGAKDTAKELTMYVEIVKPERLVNPETGLERYKNWKGVMVQTGANNHYIQTRMFDAWDDAQQKPKDAVYDKDGKLTEKGAFVSDWTKFSWFKDWKEYMVDELDDDAGISDVSDGIVFQEVVTQGMTEEFPIQFWISTNNNRAAVVLMGDPTLDQDNFLTSFGYLGRIHPFYDSQCVVKKTEDGQIVLDQKGDPVVEEKRTYFENDVAGNFAMTFGSSTMPAAIGTPPRGLPLVEGIELNVDRSTSPAKPIVGELYDKTVFSYVISYLTEVGESKPTALDGARLVVPAGTVTKGATNPEQGISVKLRFRLPDEATGYRIYRYHNAGVTSFGSDANKYENHKLVTSVEKLDRSRIIEYIDEGTALPMAEAKVNASDGTKTFTLLTDSLNVFYKNVQAASNTARSFEAVRRDLYTGAIMDVKFSNKFGKDTGTGVNDIMMYQTRSGLKYQRHQAAFITTEEFMRKEKSGQSRWTGKFHLSPIYIEHSYDKQRGWLDGVMAVDDSGIEHLDELIVDKDTPEEEVYKFFRINAPFSLFNNSPNYGYGIAIIKSSLKWK